MDTKKDTRDTKLMTLLLSLSSITRPVTESVADHFCARKISSDPDYRGRSSHWELEGMAQHSRVDYQVEETEYIPLYSPDRQKEKIPVSTTVPSVLAGSAV